METLTDKEIKPFLRWAGGKRWLVEKYSEIFPSFTGKYIEPFLGSGVVFFHLLPNKAIISDLNEEHVITYEAIKHQPKEVAAALSQMKRNLIDYYEVREWEPNGNIEIASRFIYLNRTCWNGLWRVNLSGKFNVPKGTKRIENYPDDDFRGISAILSNVDLIHGDFEYAIDQGKEGDLIFADPPYTVRHNKNGFVKYNEKIFAWKDQERLANSLIRAVNRGCYVICTNANHPSIKEIYSGDKFNFKVVSRYSGISSLSSTRNLYQELIIHGN